MTKYHPNESAAHGVKKDEKPCPVPDCPYNYKGRSDNVKRHVEKMHPDLLSEYYPPKKGSRKGKEKMQ